MAKDPGSRKRTITLETVFHGLGAGQSRPPTRAYLFDRNGELVQSEPVSDRPVNFEAEADQSYKLMVGPDLLTESKEPPQDLATRLAKAEAVTQDVAVQANALRIAVSKFIWGCWFETCIVVHGTVRKLLNPGSPNPQYAPICNGTVQIFQVDLECTLDRLAPPFLINLRDQLVNSLRGAKLAERAAIAPALSLAATAAGAVGAAMTRAAPNTAAARVTAASRAISPPASLAETATTLSALDGTMLRQAIVANKAILWPFWCELIPDWAFCWQELVEVPLQSDGSFWAEICFWCPEDFPDLYFEVVQGGVEIYDPQIACTTYYNYDGSQSVDIVIDDPRAVACMPDPGRPVPGNDLLVWPMSIGFELLENISGLESPPDSGPLPGNTTGLLSGTRPFGGSLAIKMWFDYRLKTDSNLRYYRWSYKFDDEVDFTNIGETVTHRYGTFIPTGILAHPVTLGPKTVGATAGLFDIPDPNPGDTGWINGDDRWDAPFAYFDSTGNSYPPFIYTDLAAPPRKSGMCTLKLEMFDAGGNFVPCGNLNPGVFKFVLPELGTPNTYTTTLTGNNITPAGALVFRARIDNNDTIAQLNGVTASGLSADDCGILHYTDSSAMVDVQYAATHPNNFLTWGLTISRGLAGVVESGSGATSSPPMSLPPPSTPGSFNNPASALLGPDCVDAAFAVILNCYANATDGYDTQTQYNRSAAIAFALIMP